LVIGDKDKLVTANNAAAITVTVPASVFAANDQIHVAQYGAGQVTFTGPSVTIVSAGATPAAPKLRANKSAATVICTSSNNFLIVGDIA
jgi:hypothetical protein